MNTAIFRNSAAVVFGFVAGSLVNFAIIVVGLKLLPPPEGIDMNDMEKFAENLKLLRPIDFATPWLAHAAGTFVGALFAAKIAVSHQLKIAMSIGGLFLLGGISMVLAYGGPVWFIACDLVGTYLPMAWLAGKLADRNQT